MNSSTHNCENIFTKTNLCNWKRSPLIMHPLSNYCSQKLSVFECTDNKEIELKRRLFK